MFAAAVAIAVAVERDAERDGRAGLQSLADRIELRIESQAGLLSSLRAFLVARGLEIRRGEVDAFIRMAAREGLVAGMQGIGIALYQPAGDTGDAERILLDYGEPREVWPQTDQPHRFPIVVLEPPDERNRVALGYDMYSEPVRRDAMDRAWRSGRAAATAPVELVQEITSDRQTGFLVYLPVTAPGGAIHSMVYAPYRVGDLMRNALSLPTDLGVVARVWDGEPVGEPMLDFEDGLERRAERFAIRVSDREWTLDLAYKAAAPGAGLFSLVVVIVGGVMALMAQRLAQLSERRIALELASAEEARRSAETRGLLLEEMKHRLKNVIARIGAISRLSARHADTKEEFLSVFERQLQALAAAQDLLTRQDEGTVDLRRLLEAEFASAGQSGHSVRFEGPPLSIDSARAQALGLVVHELVTNALKYGALSVPDGTLDVRWHAGDPVRIEWVERGAGSVEAEAEGFGSVLMKTLVGRQLGGRIERTASADGISITISWPA